MTQPKPTAPKTGAEHTPGTDAVHLPDRTEEARNLATEGLEEMKHGNKEEGTFLIDEARHLDRDATDAVVGKKH